MKRNLKIMISALSVMLLMAIAVTVLTFSYANNQDPAGEITDEGEIILADLSDEYTNIDNIIYNSYATGTDANPIYRIVEIGSSSKPSSLEDFVSSKGFEEFVLNAHATLGKEMNANCIEYKYFAAASVTDESKDALKYISNADFIYVSHDASSEYGTGNDICEELYNILHTYAVGDYKPLVIDSPAATSVDDSDTTTETMNSLAGDVFKGTGKYYYTFAWNLATSAEDFLAHNGSMYLGINGTKAELNGKWTKLVDTETNPDSPVERKMSKLLVVNADGSRTMSNKLLEGVNKLDVATTKFKYENGADLTGEIYDLAGSADSAFYKYAYNRRYHVPDFMEVTEVKLADIETLAINFDDYDMIIIENDCSGKIISGDLYKKFAAAMYGSITIVYDEAMETASGNSGTTNVPSDYQATNYSELYYMVATTSGVSRYQNVMVTSKQEFDIITSSKSSATAKVIADLINASSFRGIGGPASSSSMFTVLEIQPCYPVDQALAEQVGTKIARSETYSKIYGSGNYYTVPGDVVNGKTKEELEEGTQYYQWELSKAKIADMTGWSANQINLVQMSSEELAANKTEILGTYDLIYVGGNYSALKEADEYLSLIRLAGYGGVLKSNGLTLQAAADKLAQLPIYTMYSHSGDFVSTTVATYGGVVQGKVASSQVVLNGERKSNSFAVLNGNDITYNNLLALNEYVKAGMPVIFSKDISAAYDIAKDKGYLQNSLDPDSNMYKFIDACMTRTNDSSISVKNVLWNFDQTKVVRTDTNDGKLGDTATGYVYVFADKNSVDIIDGSAVSGNKSEAVKLIADSAKRPKITLTKSPAIYNMYDDSTKLSDGTLNFEYRVTTTSKNYTVKLYVDDNGNSVFDEDPIATGSNNKLTYQAATSFYGPVYWKLEVTDQLGMTTSKTGLSYIKNKSDNKQIVRILQIMPSSKLVNTSDPARDPNTLFFCTVCQQTYHRLDWNPSSDGGDRDSYIALYSGNYTDSNDGMDRAKGRIYMGRHEHEFGIVKYDSNLELPAGTPDSITKYGTTGMDDWDLNLADEVSDLYDFDLDIMTREEFEEISNEVKDAYDFSNMSDDDKAKLINSFSIDEKDEDYALYSALTTDDAKVSFIKQREYEQLASKYWQLYQYMSTQRVASDNVTADEDGNAIAATTLDQEDKMVAMIQKIIANADNPPYANGNTTFSCTSAKLKSELQRLIDERCYWDYYSINNFAALSNDVSVAYLGESFDPYYAAYVKAKDKELEYKDLYKKYDRLAHPDNWLLGCYETVILGPSEDFAGDDITDPYALADLKGFIDGEGTLLLFHDTLTKFQDSGSVTLTSTLRESFGMDRYHMELDTAKLSDSETITENVVFSGILEEISINNYDLTIRNEIAANVQNVNIDAVVGSDGKTTYSYSTEGTISGAGDIQFNFTYKDADGNPIANRDCSVQIRCWNPYSFTQSASGTTDADGKVTVSVPNYEAKTTTYTNDDVYYLPYKTTQDDNMYFMSNLSTKNDNSKYYTWLSDMKRVLGATKGNYLTDVAYTDVVAISDQSNNSLALPYKYADVEWNIFVNWNQDAQGTAKTFTKFGTNKASQNNKGIITMFPFTLSDELNISGTHSQAYALDIEDSEMTVWYSLAASNNDKGGSSVFAASPRDGMDNYFIYSYNNVYYCGAGHSKVTGIGKDNNDERRLYINIICNSVRRSIKQPTIYVYDYQKDTTGDKIKIDGNGAYYTKVTKVDEYPEFSFKVIVDEETTLENVKIYYDLDYSADNQLNDYVANDKHKLVVDWDSNNVNAGDRKDVFRYDATLEKLRDSEGRQVMEIYVDSDGTEYEVAATMLKLQAEYFEPYNNEYTYIVIEATDSKGQKVYQRIKVMLKDVLFNLT